MLALVIILAALLLILTVPLGVDAAYSAEQAYLKLKIGLFRKTLLPRTAGKTKPRKEKQAQKQPAEQSPDKPKRGRSLTLNDLLTLAEIALQAIRRVRARLSVDYFRLRWVAAAADPYDAVLQYGRVNAGLGLLCGGAHRAMDIREEDITTELDLSAPRPSVETRIVLSIQVWELIWIGACTAWAGLQWLTQKKRTARAAAAAEERSSEDGEL